MYEKQATGDPCFTLDSFVFELLRRHAHDLLAIIDMSKVEFLIDQRTSDVMATSRAHHISYTFLTPLAFAIEYGCSDCVAAVATANAITKRVGDALPIARATKHKNNPQVYNRIVATLQSFSPNVITRYI